MRKFLYSFGILLMSSGMAFAGNDTRETEETEKNEQVKPVRIDDDGRHIVDIDNYGVERSARSLLPQYKVPIVEIGKISSSPRETPRTINTISKTEINDLGAQNISDAFKIVPGVLNTSSARGSTMSYSIRGYMLDMYKGGKLNGLPILGFNDMDTFNVSRVNILKGPGAGLYGQGNVGGTVNLITYKPSYTNTQRIELGYGSNDFVKGAFSSEGTLARSADGNYGAAYYIGGSKVDTESTQNMIERKKDTVYGSVLFSAPNVYMTVDGGYTKGKNDGVGDGRFLPSVNNKPLNVSRKTNFSTASDRLDQEAWFVGYNIVYDTYTGWKVSNSGRYSQSLTQGDYVSIPGLKDDGSFKNPSLSSFDMENRLWVSDTNVTYDNPLFGHENTFVVGFDYTQQRIQREDYFAEGHNIKCVGQSCSLNGNFNIFNFDSFSNNYNWRRAGKKSGGTPSYDKNLGVYIQDRFHIINNTLILDAGVRYDTIITDGHSPAVWEKTEHFISPNVGLTWNVTDYLSVYGNYATGVTSGTSRGTYHPPEKTDQYEIGVRADWLYDYVTSDLSLFWLEKEDVSYCVEGFGRNCLQYGTIGSERNIGFELMNTIHITQEWDLMASWTHYRSKLIKTERNANNGNRFVNVPTNTVSLWTVYKPQSGFLKDFGIGGGPRFVSSRYADMTNTTKLAGYGVVDAFIYYDIKPDVRLQLNANNILDKKYYAGAGSSSTIFYGEGQYFLGTLKMKF